MQKKFKNCCKLLSTWPQEHQLAGIPRGIYPKSAKASAALHVAQIPLFTQPHTQHVAHLLALARQLLFTQPHAPHVVQPSALARLRSLLESGLGHAQRNGACASNPDGFAPRCDSNREASPESAWICTPRRALGCERRAFASVEVGLNASATTLATEMYARRTECAVAALCLTLGPCLRLDVRLARCLSTRRPLQLSRLPSPPHAPAGGGRPCKQAWHAA